MKILVACEYSGVVRDAFRRRGHDAWSCDIIPSEADNTYHMQCDVREILKDGWDMMIAHPPCTYISNAGAKHLYKTKGVLNVERYEKGMEGKKLFMELWESGIEKICIENPVPSKIFELPMWSQIIQPWMFGHPYQKRTCLWLKGLDVLVPTDVVEKGLRENTRVVGNWYNKAGSDAARQKGRARTFYGIGDAMGGQWG